MIPLKRLTLLFLIVAVLAIPSAAWWYWPTRLPHPAECSRHQLFRWIALRDLAVEPIETQRALIDRFQTLLVTDPSSATVEVDPAYQSQVDRNRILLRDLWFSDCVDAFDQLDGSKRPEFLDQQLRTAISWQSFNQRDQTQTENGGASSIGRVVTHWIESAGDSETRNRVISVLGAATVRWLSTYDVADLSAQARESFADELFDQLQRNEVAPVVAKSVNLDVESNESDRLLGNGELLLEAWFCAQARQHHALETDEQRRQFVKDKVATVRQSPLLTMLTQNGQHRTSPLVQVLRIQQMIQGWIQRADKNEKRMLQEFSTAVYREVIEAFNQA